VAAFSVRILDLDPERARPIDRFESIAARHLGVARLAGRGGLGLIHLGPGGVLGRHPAAAPQLFYVIQGDGWVSGADGERIEIGPGQAALWDANEEHESGTTTGMTAVVLEIEKIEPG
jgi:quercetin dioxygenase-like cupin family protein